MSSASETYNSYAERGINQERLDAILEFGGTSILDVGCGSGAYVLELAGKYQIFGVDYQSFPTWDKMPHLFSISDATELAWNDNTIDTILSFETLEHLQDPKKALKEYYRVCRKNIILTVPNCAVTPAMLQSQLIYKTWIDRTHVQFFDIESIAEVTESVGFRVIKQYHINKISLFPLISEAFNTSGLMGKIAWKILSKRQIKDYYITSLLVAEK
ncbi:MAG: class I SAM-dependent methyltransferase [Aulosira sp. DedVER01a]|nr:class I SAM-dependent methyltransferase [Aulosira sp. ZfuVER01]